MSDRRHSEPDPERERPPQEDEGADKHSNIGWNRESGRDPPPPPPDASDG